MTRHEKRCLDRLYERLVAESDEVAPLPPPLAWKLNTRHGLALRLTWMCRERSFLVVIPINGPVRCYYRETARTHHGPDVDPEKAVNHIRTGLLWLLSGDGLDAIKGRPLDGGQLPAGLRAEDLERGSV